MNAARIYLDYNATSPLRVEARDAVSALLACTGNPSSVHAEGRAARARIEEARLVIARVLGTEPQSVIFTSGATEALNLALTPALRDGGPAITDLLVSTGEHSCVLDGHRFPVDRCHRVPLNGDGQVDLPALGRILSGLGGRALVAVHAANNETGVLQPIAEISALVHGSGHLLACDAVQAVGRVPFDLASSGADVAVISGHKLGGLAGAGALAFANRRLHIEAPMVRGGGQERGSRSGTENLCGIVSLAAALAAALAGRGVEQARLGILRERMEVALRRSFPDVVIFGAAVERLANTTAFAIPGVRAETLLIALDLAGVAVSSGSACSSGRVRPSHVLAGMGVDPALAQGALRVSSGWATCEGDVEGFCRTLEKTVRNMRERRTASAVR